MADNPLSTRPPTTAAPVAGNLLHIVVGGVSMKIEPQHLFQALLDLATYDPGAVAGDVFDMDNMVESATAKIFTNLERIIVAYLQKISGTEFGDTLNLVGLSGLQIDVNRNGHVGLKAQNTNAGTSAVSSFIASISGTDYLRAISLQMMGDNYFRAVLAGKGLLYSTDDICMVTNNNKELCFYTTPDFVTFTQQFLFGINGNWIKIKETADTGSVIDLGYTVGDGNLCNMASANTNTTYTLTNVRTGGKAEVLINAGTQPTVTGATLIKCSDFITSTDMYLCLRNNGNVTQYWFEQIAP